MASSDHDLSVILKPNEILTVEIINDQIIPFLLTHFSDLRSSIPRQTTLALPAPDSTSSKSAVLDPQVTSNPTDSPRLKSKNRPKAKTKHKKNGHRNSSNKSNSGQQDVLKDEAQLCEQIDRLHRDLSYIREELDRLKRIEDSVGGLVRELVQYSTDNAFMGLKKAQAQADDLDSGGGGSSAVLQLHEMQIKLSLVTYIISRLKLQIPYSHRILSTSSDAHRYEQALDEMVADSMFGGMPKPRVGPDLLWSSAYRDFCSVYHSLDLQLKLCLLCFAVFPEQAVIKKRVMSYWWIGEGLLDPAVKKQKTTAGDVLGELAAKDFIQPIVKKRRLGAKSYRMHPIVRFMVINLAKEANFFDFDSKGYATADFSKSHRACLVKSEHGSWQHALENPDINFDKLHTLFNVNEAFLDFKLDWFLRMTNVNVLSLGRWKGSPNHHIEVEGTEFFKGLRGMKHLKFFSLQGISRIFELPGSIGELYKLKILDLRACHNLESLPDSISSLKELTNLDASGCYLLDSLPKGIGSLSKLEVLMGFVINDRKQGSSCTLNDLVKLRKLRKLGIVTMRKSFPQQKERWWLRRLGALKKLKISWGGKSFSSTSSKDARTSTTRDLGLPDGLEKLDLECYPLENPPGWLSPGKLRNLNALYIRGGNLHCLCKDPKGDGDPKWTVKILRLKYLNEFRMNWIELRDSFPKLVCLQKINCPRLTLFPCDETGLWLNEEQDEASRFKKKDDGAVAR
ncbi:hypothetical protein CDL15_Pgr021500 [Punica granatum]|uniref:Disease resistance R13L4/SHOC-2-like LRR domain-containing protein n=1 Tax=Punica granatum TaxID=22663 RepID=A0A218XN90_PUNGR|nr:hypothetical protein CDL15_Pgr021500 [Punica granatum]PKI39765.1 hypothetical protein CRG98_039810 [Punica granatum]